MRIKRCKHGIDLYMIVDFGCVKRKQGIAFILGSLFHAGILIDKGCKAMILNGLK